MLLRHICFVRNVLRLNQFLHVQKCNIHSTGESMDFGSIPAVMVPIRMYHLAVEAVCITFKPIHRTHVFTIVTSEKCRHKVAAT